MKYLLGCDFGGGASKATLLREDGAVAATATHEYPTSYPRAGWAEQDPDDSYRAFVDNVRELLCTSGVRAADVAALCLDGATHTAVLLDENDRVIRPAIYWTDKRAGEEAAFLKEKYGEMIVERAFNSPSALWTLPQLMWLQAHEPENHARIRRVLSMKDYVRYRLTGDFVTDSIEAMGFMLLDARTNEWDAELLNLCGLTKDVMPRIVDPQCVLGAMSAQALADTGLSPETKVIAGSTDTVMEVYASGAIHPGQATLKLATAGRICPITDHAILSPLLVTYRHVVSGLWYPGSATKSCAASNRWYRDTLCGGEVMRAEAQGTDAYLLMSAAAETVPAGCDGLFFHPYLQGEITPYLDDRLRGSFVGATASHTKAHFNRAVLEGVGYSMKDCYEALRGLGIAPDSATIIGGGAKSPLWRQIVADMLNIPLTTVENVDSSLGSAMLAGVACGTFADFEDSVKKCVRVKDRTLPNPETHALYEKNFAVYRRIHDALAPIYHDYED